MGRLLTRDVEVRKKLVTKHTASIVAVLAASLLLRIVRVHLQGESAPLAPWTSQVIFGFYFTVLTLAIQALTSIRRGDPSQRGRKILLLLILIGVSTDLVLVNVREIKEHVAASYGPIVAWDVATFFIWLRAIELSRSRSASGMNTSWTVSIAPLFGLGREILVLPYKPPHEALAYLDLVFGHLFTLVWLALPFVDYARARNPPGSWQRLERTLSILIFTGCAYWIVSGVENAIGLVWPPFYPDVYELFNHHGIPIPLLNYLQFVLALAITISVWRWNAFGIGTTLGIEKVNTVSSRS